MVTGRGQLVADPLQLRFDGKLLRHDGLGPGQAGRDRISEGSMDVGPRVRTVDIRQPEGHDVDRTRELRDAGGSRLEHEGLVRRSLGPLGKHP